MTIYVTQRHIRHGIKLNCNFCPIALAINAVLSNNHYASITIDITLNTKGQLFGLNLPIPLESKDFIRRFDYGYKVEPFSFDLDIPKEFLFKSK